MPSRRSTPRSCSRESAVVTEVRRPRPARQQPVRQRHRHADPFAAPLAEAVGEVPEEHVEPALDPAMADDRDQGREVVGAEKPAPDQGEGDLREGRGAAGEVLVEDRDPGSFDHQPAGFGRDAGPVADPVPGTQQVPRPDQLGAVALVLDDAAAEDAGDNQQAEAGARHIIGVPGSPRDLQRLREAAPFGEFPTATALDAGTEIGIETKNGDCHHSDEVPAGSGTPTVPSLSGPAGQSSDICGRSGKSRLQLSLPDRALRPAGAPPPLAGPEAALDR